MQERNLSVPSSYDAHLLALKEKHSLIDHRIEEAKKHPSSTDFYLRQLKKQKLLIKEEIEGLRKAS